MGITVNVAKDAVECVAIGTGKSLEWVQVLHADTGSR
jgi:actin-like ATPase involved in cell morphogenesis